MKHKSRHPPAEPERATAASAMAAGLRKLEALKIEPDVELHRSSSGRNIRLKHSKAAAAAALASPHGLTPRAPDRRRPQDQSTQTPPHARKRSMSAHGDFAADDSDAAREPATSTSTPATPTPVAIAEAAASPPSNQDADSVAKPSRRFSGKREDRRSSFMIHEPWEQLGFARALSPESRPREPSEPSNQEAYDPLEEKATTPLRQIAEEAVRPPRSVERQQPALLPSTKRDVYAFDLWKNAGRNRRLHDAVSGYDSAPSPPRPSPPRSHAPTKRRSSSADQTVDDSPAPTPSQNLYESARALAGRQGFGRQHHSVDVSRALSDSAPSDATTGGLDLSLTRSTSPIIGSSGSVRSRAPLSHHARSVPLSDANDDRAIVRWRRGELLGEGTFGKVYKGLNAETGEFFALKEIEIRAVTTDDQARQLQKLSEEIEVMHNLRHEHIVRYKGSHRTDKHFFIFMEFVPGGSIANNLQQFGAFDEDLVRNYTRQIVDGVAYLHEKDIIHRDIKGANVLVTDQGVAKLADFGCSKQLPEIITTSLEESLRSIRGSIPWMAPEVVQQTGHSHKADIWSIGATVIEMASGRHPWPALTNGLAAMYMIATCKSSPPIPSHLSDEAKSFLARCFCINPDERASAVELSQHAFLRHR